MKYPLSLHFILTHQSPSINQFFQRFWNNYVCDYIFELFSLVNTTFLVLAVSAVCLRLIAKTVPNSWSSTHTSKCRLDLRQRINAIGSIGLLDLAFKNFRAFIYITFRRPMTDLLHIKSLILIVLAIFNAIIQNVMWQAIFHGFFLQKIKFPCFTVLHLGKKETTITDVQKSENFYNDTGIIVASTWEVSMVFVLILLWHKI